MTLTDLLRRELLIEWHEAVAVVREVADRIDENAGSVPELHQVELLSRGEIEVHGDGATVSDPGQRLGQLLQVLLTRADPPVQLRLLIAQTHDSAQAFSEALAFFERPDRPNVLRFLYERASTASPAADADGFVGSLTAVEENSDDIDKTDGGSSVLRRRLSYAAALLLVVLAVGTAFAFARNEDGGSSDGSAPGLPARLADGVSEAATAVGSMVAALGDKVGLGSGTPESPSPVEAVPSPAPSAIASRSKGSRPGNVNGRNLPLQAAALSAFDLGSSPEKLTPASESPDSQPLIVDDRVVRSQEGQIYSADSPGVSAPVGIRPQLPKELPPGVSAQDLTRIELTILPDGTVDSVRLIGQPRNIHESMLLSAAKAWQFHPAMKDGFPVRYRKTIWVAR